MRRGFIAIVALLLFGLIVPTALAANVHFVKGPTFTDNGTTLTTSGKLAGLGNGDVTITVSATGTATKITCTNKGGNQAPGQNKPKVATVGQTTIPSNQVKNGSVTFSVTTVSPSTLDWRTAGCPNSNWTGRIDDVSFSSATVKVEQGGSVVLNRSFSL